MNVVFCTEAGSVRESDGTIVRLSPGEAWEADDQFVKAHPEKFAASPPVLRHTRRGSYTIVEQATAAPGEKRASKRGR